ncbi:putative ribonuclease H protein [Camellia lanceoleosa]|uniref:Ribonuclease H protein n=1 Tax=Camellia lanceoleosa TaxID=1840588 RepID=A0ACC0J4Z7_9ERIC|nr:putative ribonuclease H protein [Camellia lanceoleosa]
MLWDESKIRLLVSEEDCEAILSIPVSSNDRDDTLVGHYDSKGSYMVKSGYQEAIKQAHLGSNLPSSSSSWSEKKWKFVWSLNLPSKLRHFLWKIYHNALATKQNLHHRYCANSDRCPMCLKKTESLDHLLFECEWAKRVWFGSGLGLRCDMLGMDSVKNWIGNYFESLGASSWGKTTICSMDHSKHVNMGLPLMQGLAQHLDDPD